MDLSVYFKPIIQAESDFLPSPGKNRIGDIIQKFTDSDAFPDLSETQLAIIGVNEDRAAMENMGCGQGPDEVRKQLYQLFFHTNTLQITDLGNIISGNSIDDTYFALKEVIAELIKADILPLIIGGSQDLTYANYLAYENIGRVVNIAAIDPIFDLGHDEHELNARSYLSRIILHQPNFLFNFTNIGYQSYFVDQEAVSLMKNLFFDANRLGVVRKDMEEAEPMIRNADILSFDMAAIRYSDSPGNAFSGPNGFSGEEACQLCRYAGMSDKLSSVGFYGLNPRFDQRGISAQLLAQMIWYFIDGFMNRQHDFPGSNKEQYIRYTVKVEDFEDDLVFLKSKKTDRWWMEVSTTNKTNRKYIRHQFVPCSYGDYQSAMEHEIPDRWLKVQQKLM